MEHSGEQFRPDVSTPFEIKVNVDRYMAALPYLKDKVVLDIGCGSGLGTYLYSLVAKHVIAVDYNSEIIQYASRFPFPEGKVSFLQADLTNQIDIANLPPHDICVAIEVLEHLIDPDAVLKQLHGRELFFSVPLNSMHVSSWHRYDIGGEEDVRRLISPSYDVNNYEEQSYPNSYGKWIHGHGIKYEGN